LEELGVDGDNIKIDSSKNKLEERGVDRYDSG
jgi:hypothetical protein